MRTVLDPPIVRLEDLLAREALSVAAGAFAPFVIWTAARGPVWITGDRMTNVRYRPDPPPTFDAALDRALREMRETYLRQRDRR